MVELPRETEEMTWLLALYGAAMLSVQLLEQEISLLYAVANVDPRAQSNASPRRQWMRAATRSWRAFQQGSSGMKLNDAKAGIKQHLDPMLYAEVEAFIGGPRNQLAHRFLVERVVSVNKNGKASLARCAIELISAHQDAVRLARAVKARSDEIRASWPEAEEPPDEVKAHLEAVARLVVLK